MLDRFRSFLDSHHRILLTTHENPDGDGTGAMVGLAHLLVHLGKEVRIVVSPRLPHFLAFMDGEGRVEAFDPGGVHAQLSDWPDLWLVVDASEPHRLGAMHASFEASKAVKACLDHHMKDAPKGFDVEFLDSAASASAQLVHRLAADAMVRPLPKVMAIALYAGIVDDTGNFRFSNATAEVHRIAADLIEDGVEPARVYQALYHQGRTSKLKIQGRAFDRMALLEGGTYARMNLTKHDMTACEAVHDDLEGLVNKPLELQGVEVSCLLEELEDGRTKISLRSRERVNVNAVARQFGGGGHYLASGAKTEGSLDDVSARLDVAIQARLREDLSH